MYSLIDTLNEIDLLTVTAPVGADDSTGIANVFPMSYHPFVTIPLCQLH